MAQHDYDIANQAGASFRADLNAALAAIVTTNSGAAAPSPTFAYQLWADTTANQLKMRNSANTAWITVGTLDSANLGLALASALAAKVEKSGDTMTGALAFPAGTAAAPSVRVGSEQNGMFSPAPNELDLTTGGVSRININAVGDTTLNNAARLRGKNSTGSIGALIYRGSDDITYIGEPAFGNPLIMRPGGAIHAAPGNVVRWMMDTGGRLLAGNITPATGFSGVGDVTLSASAAIQSRSTFSAWVRHDNAGTIVRALNVDSVTKNGTGDYTANIKSGVMADGNYGFMHMCSNPVSNAAVIQLSSVAPTATGFRYQTFNTNSLSTQDIGNTVIGFLP